MKETRMPSVISESGGNSDNTIYQVSVIRTYVRNWDLLLTTNDSG